MHPAGSADYHEIVLIDEPIDQRLACCVVVLDLTDPQTARAFLSWSSSEKDTGLLFPGDLISAFVDPVSNSDRVLRVAKGLGVLDDTAETPS